MAIKRMLKRIKRELIGFIRIMSVVLLILSFITLWVYTSTADGQELECLTNFINYEATHVYDDKGSEALNEILEEDGSDISTYFLLMQYNDFYSDSVFEYGYNQTISSMEEALEVYTEMCKAAGDLPYCNTYIRNAILQKAHSNIVNMADPECEEYYQIMYVYTRDRIPLLTYKNKNIYSFIYGHWAELYVAAFVIVVIGLVAEVFIFCRRCVAIKKGIRFLREMSKAGGSE